MDAVPCLDEMIIKPDYDEFKKKLKSGAGCSKTKKSEKDRSVLDSDEKDSD